MKATSSLTVTPHGDREILMTRVFDAPRERVFQGLTQPDIVRRWLLGPDGWSMPTCEIDLNIGAAYRYVWRKDADGTEMAVHGLFREIVPPERLAHTEKFEEPWYPGEAIITSTLTDQGGKTLLSVTMLYPNQETRDGVLKSGMEQGVAASYDRLDDILARTARS